MKDLILMSLRYDQKFPFLGMICHSNDNIATHLVIWPNAIHLFFAHLHFWLKRKPCTTYKRLVDC